MLQSILICFFAVIMASYSTSNTFNGTWQLDKGISQSPVEMLKLMGVGLFRRRMMSNLEMTETFIITHRNINVERTTAFSHTQDTYFFGVNTSKVDPIMGSGTRIVNFNAGNLYTRFIRSDGAIYTSVEELALRDQIRMTMDFAISGSNVTCIRYFRRV